MSVLRVKNSGAGIVATVGGTDYSIPAGETVLLPEDVARIVVYRHGRHIQIDNEPAAEGDEALLAETVQSASEASILRDKLEAATRAVVETTKTLTAVEGELAITKEALAKAEAELVALRPSEPPSDKDAPDEKPAPKTRKSKE